MQVYPEPPGSSAATFASSAAGYDAGKPEGVSFTSQTLQAPPPPAYAPPAYEPAANAYGFNPSFTAAPAQYGAPSGYGVAPAGYGYRVGPLAPQTQLQNSQNVQLNVMHATALTPVVITQPAPVVMSPPTYLGWSIFNFLCCFWPLGLAAIIYSTKVGSARNHGEAKSYSLTARNLNIAATTIAPILVIVVVCSVVGATTSSVSSSGYSPSYYANAYYYSYGYDYYYTYLMYYTYYKTYSYLVYSSYYNYYYRATSYSSRTATGYQYATASKYTTDYNYQYAQGVYYYYYG